MTVIAECNDCLGLTGEVYLVVLSENEIPVVTDSSEVCLLKQLLLVNAECLHGLTPLVGGAEKFDSSSNIAENDFGNSLGCWAVSRVEGCWRVPCIVPTPKRRQARLVFTIAQRAKPTCGGTPGDIRGST